MTEVANRYDGLGAIWPGVTNAEITVDTETINRAMFGGPVEALVIRRVYKLRTQQIFEYNTNVERSMRHPGFEFSAPRGGRFIIERVLGYQVTDGDPFDRHRVLFIDYEINPVPRPGEAMKESAPDLVGLPETPIGIRGRRMRIRK